jgi:hypothetical protein
MGGRLSNAAMQGYLERRLALGRPCGVSEGQPAVSSQTLQTGVLQHGGGG